MRMVRKHGTNLIGLALVLSAAVAWSGCAAPKPGILVMAHGGDAEWNEAVEQAVAPLREKHAVEIAYGMARSSTMKDAIERLEARGVDRIAVVRMFVSGDSFLERTEYIVGLRDELPHVAHASSGGAGGGHHMERPERVPTSAPLILSRDGVADSPLIDEILVDRISALSVDPSRECVLILAHGPRDEAENERWLAKMRLRAQRVHEIGPFRHVQCETLREDWPGRRVEAERRIRRYVQDASRDGGRVIVVPFRVAGFGPYRKVLDGLDYVADGRGFCPHPNMTRWIEETAETCLDRNAPQGASDSGR